MFEIPQDFLARAKRNLNLADFGQTSKPVWIGYEPEYKCPFERQYILRMMVRSPESSGFKIPTELDWLRSTIIALQSVQSSNGLKNGYVYVTVRHGLVNSETDDDWHVDGFSMRVPHHPEQNYAWTSVDATEYQNKAFPLPADFDPLKHNIHSFLSANADEKLTCNVGTNQLFLFDPYFVHRRPANSGGKMRTFFRISFIPIEIEDDTCTQNPLMPVKTYGRKDIRQTLVNYPLDK